MLVELVYIYILIANRNSINKCIFKLLIMVVFTSIFIFIIGCGSVFESSY